MKISTTIAQTHVSQFLSFEKTKATTNINHEEKTTTSIMAILTPKKLKKQFKAAMKSTETNSKKEPAQVPVFMLPHSALSPIPEDGEVYQGFYVRLSLKPHQERIYSGLMSLSNLDEEAIEKSATTELEYRHYCRPAKVAKRNHHCRDMSRIITTE
mmetsp:Transcript_20837/g.42899  ORF Transcript_20837/g.42899 Transcript_20837/m.42899 type:complete len:156 (-) Transcript_20837:1781-2248(-)